MPSETQKQEKESFDILLKKMVTKIKDKYKPEKIILFGSYAHGKPKKDSDIDLLIIKKTTDRHIDRAVKVCEIIKKENRLVAIDTLVYTPDEINMRLKLGDDFIKGILENGITLYG